MKINTRLPYSAPENRTPMRSTWRDPIGVALTDRRIVNRIKQGWYGEIAKLRQLARSANKAVKNKAKQQLKRYEGSHIATASKRTRPIDISEFA